MCRRYGCRWARSCPACCVTGSLGKASDYVIQPFTQDEREQILPAYREAERPMIQFWFNTGLRPGEFQALRGEHIDMERRIAQIVLIVMPDEPATSIAVDSLVSAECPKCSRERALTQDNRPTAIAAEQPLDDSL